MYKRLDIFTDQDKKTDKIRDRGWTDRLGRTWQHVWTNRPIKADRQIDNVEDKRHIDKRMANEHDETMLTYFGEN